MEFSTEMKKKLLELSGLSNMKDLESIIKDKNVNLKGVKAYNEKIKEFMETPGVFNEKTFEKVWDLFLQDYSDVQNYYEECKDESRSIQKSVNLRTKGNEAYKKKCLETSINLYSDSIKAIPPSEDGSEPLALSFANRSAAFYEIKSFSQSLNDVEAALYFNYPLDKRHKLYERRAKILIQLGFKSLAKKEYEKAVENIQSHGGKVSENLLKAMDDFDNCSNEDEFLGKSLEEYLGQNLNSSVNLSNSQFPALRRGLKVEFDEIKGRHCITETEIPAGELVLCEDPIVSYLHPSFNDKNCSACFKPLNDYCIPSLKSTKYYCNLSCLKEDNKFHDFWKAHNVLGEDRTLNIHLSIKAIQCHDATLFEDQMDKLLKTDYMFGSNKSKEFSYYDKKEQYRTIFSLVDHPKERNLDEECKIYARTVLAIRLLRESGYLKYKISNQECRQTDLAVARALYKLNTGFKYNLHSIHEVSDTEASSSMNKCVPLRDIGSGIYPTLLFLNHSCNPNTYRFHQGKRVFLYSKRKIYPGEELTDCYGMHHLSMPYEERQSNLCTGYCFNCQCDACTFKYPLFHELKQQNQNETEPKVLKEKLSRIKSLFEEKLYLEAADVSRSLLTGLYESKEQQSMKPYISAEHVGLVFCYCQWIYLSKQIRK